MSSDEFVAFGVTLSSELRNLMLSLMRSNTAEVTLGEMVAVFDDIDAGKDITFALKVSDAHRRIQTNPSTDRSALREELHSLLVFWGQSYRLQYLLDAHEQGIRTHERLRDLLPNKAFSFPEADGSESSAMPNEWVRRRVGGATMINGLVPAQQIVGDTAQGDVHLFDPNTVVRPVFAGPSRLKGCHLPTPMEHQSRIIWWATFDQAVQKMADRVDEAINQSMREIHLSYCAHKSDEHGLPIDNLDDTAVIGKVILVADGDASCPENDSQNYESPVMEDPTWLEICVLANAMIETTNDLDHVYLEGIEEDEEQSSQRSDGIQVYRFCMGS